MAQTDLNCSVVRVLDLIGERWTLLVLREAFMGVRRFTVMQRELGVARNVLSDRLGKLVEHGILERRQYQDRPARFEYRLTEKGKELQPAILTLLRWGDDHLAPHGKPSVLVHDGCGHVAHAQVVCSHCGEPLTAHNVSLQAGPGLDSAQAAA
jgi:DNA-binding HxlR family transcriptional regulator